MNRSIRIILQATFTFIGLLFVNELNAKDQPVKLTCEYHHNPVGIDVATPRLGWQMQVAAGNWIQSAYEIKVAASPADLKSGKSLVWSSGKQLSRNSVNVACNGINLLPMQRYYWQVRVWDSKGKVSDWSTPAFWEMGLLSPEGWSAEWITNGSENDTKTSQPASYFRKPFRAKAKVQSARLYVTALGLYEMYINGQRVGDQLFTPGWTSYKKRLQYQTYDVTAMLQSDNAIGAIIGDGWYRGFIGFSGQRNYYGTKTALLAQLRIVYADGSEELISSGSDWKVATGPILESDIYNGEKYDARLEKDGWDSAGFDDSKWEAASSCQYPKNQLVAPQGVAVRAIEEIKPVKVFRTPKNELVLDMGQNMVGVVRLKVSGNRGEVVSLRYAEVLDKEGNFYTQNLRAAKNLDVYTLKGGGEEIFQPRFTFHGFRYVQVEGVENITPDQITGVVIHSDMAPAGTFACSDSLINQLQHNIQWGQKGNFLDVPTDCPQRDERLGWTGDAQVFCPTAAFNFNTAAFYTKWLADVSHDQTEAGSVPYVVPDVLNGASGSTAWADAAIIVPWQVYLTYGDTRILEVQYPGMKKWVEFMRNRAGDDLLWKGDFHFGDWLAFATTRSDYPGATTEKDLIATAYFSWSAGLLAKIAGIIGNETDAKSYAELSEKIKAAFVKEYVTPNGRLVSHTQTAYCLALSFNLLPGELNAKAAAFLADDVRTFGHLTTGFVGTPLLCNTLSKWGYDDLAFKLINRKEYPSWLYPVTQGATTIWERWDGQKPDGSFQDVGMNSFNHYAYGAIGEWLYHYVAGLVIDPKNPGYSHFFVTPHPGGGLTHAKATYKSMYGQIVSSWNIESGKFICQVEVPANTTATIELPKSANQIVLLNGTPLDQPKSAGTITGDKDISIELGSGDYRFEYVWK